MRAADAFALWHGAPVSIFPLGSHVFPAHLGRLRELQRAIEADAQEVHFVDQPESGARPLRMAALVAFLARYRPAFDLAVGETLRHNSLAFAQKRRAALLAIGAPSVILEDIERELRLLSAPEWRGAVEPATLLPDANGCASLVDVEHRTARGESLDVDADVSDLVLVAGQCAVAPDALGMMPSALDGALAWVSLMDFVRSETPGPAGAVRVRPAVYQEHVRHLAFAPVSASVAPGGAVLAVSLAVDD